LRRRLASKTARRWPVRGGGSRREARPIPSGGTNKTDPPAWVCFVCFLFVL